ncbi:MAG TPA: hypothetical protein ENK57_10250 [Polyangiaceae bacterium]|nr:hypothetical protein [Polyangiaceae bacterium]
MNHAADFTHFRPIDRNIPNRNNDQATTDLQNPTSRPDNPACDCPFPWWWVLLAGIAGGGIGYYAGKQGQAEDELLP